MQASRSATPLIQYSPGRPGPQLGGLWPPGGALRGAAACKGVPSWDPARRLRSDINEEAVQQGGREGITRHAAQRSSHHAFSRFTSSSSSGVKSFFMLKRMRISSGVLPLISSATVLHVRSRRALMSK